MRKAIAVLLLGQAAAQLIGTSCPGLSVNTGLNQEKGVIVDGRTDNFWNGNANKPLAGADVRETWCLQTVCVWGGGTAASGGHPPSVVCLYPVWSCPAFPVHSLSPEHRLDAHHTHTSALPDSKHPPHPLPHFPPIGLPPQEIHRFFYVTKKGAKPLKVESIYVNVTSPHGYPAMSPSKLPIVIPVPSGSVQWRSRMILNSEVCRRSEWAVGDQAHG
jgi:hypothetical protein